MTRRTIWREAAMVWALGACTLPAAANPGVPHDGAAVDVASEAVDDVLRDASVEPADDGPAPLVCGEGSARCQADGGCVSLASDNLHCGACNTACVGGTRCQGGGCVTTCSEGYVECGGSCVRLASDNAHCGACGNVCEGNLRCLAGVCGCASPLTNCDGACVDTTASRAHCGVCGRACEAGQLCRFGVCVPDCGPGQTQCVFACVDTRTDRNHCGACSAACPAEAECVDAQCRCRAGLRFCVADRRCVTDNEFIARLGACAPGADAGADGG